MESSSTCGGTDLGLDNDHTVIRSLSMSANVANSVKEEGNFLIRLKMDEETTTIDTTTELIYAGRPQMPTNIAMASSSCSHTLPGEEDGIITGIVLSKWDDIIGPQTVHVWLQEGFDSNYYNDEEPASCYHKKNVMLMKAIKYVTGHTVNYMGVTAAYPRNSPHGVTTSSTFKEKNTSLFIVPDLDIVAHSLVFTVQNKLLNIPYSVALIVKYKNYKYYLNVHRICQLWLRRLADQLHQLILSLNQSGNAFVTNEQVEHRIFEFDKILFSLSPIFRSRMEILPYMGECEKTVLILPCIERALVSHLQTSGCSVVMGTSPTDINALIKFLALFLEERELHFCRFVNFLYNFPYHMGLFLQGLLLDEYGCRQLCAEDLAANPYQVTAIDLTRVTSIDAVKQSTAKHHTHLRHQNMFNPIKSCNSKLVRELLADLNILPTNQWKQMAKLFMKKVTNLALTLLNLKEKIRGTDHPSIKAVDLQCYLRLAMDLEEDDFLIVQSMANKIIAGNSF